MPWSLPSSSSHRQQGKKAIFQRHQKGRIFFFSISISDVQRLKIDANEEIMFSIKRWRHAKTLFMLYGKQHRTEGWY
jgi:hypothetical protein